MGCLGQGEKCWVAMRDTTGSYIRAPSIEEIDGKSVRIERLPDIGVNGPHVNLEYTQDDVYACTDRDTETTYDQYYRPDRSYLILQHER